MAQGLGNIVCGLCGAIGGNSLIGESIMNVRLGARGRLSAIWSAMLLLVTIVGLNGGM